MMNIDVYRYFVQPRGITYVNLCESIKIKDYTFKLTSRTLFIFIDLILIIGRELKFKN